MKNILYLLFGFISLIRIGMLMVLVEYEEVNLFALKMIVLSVITVICFSRAIYSFKNEHYPKGSF